MMNQEAAKALIYWSPINERIIKARFYSRFIKLTILHMYAPINDADEQTKQDLYEKLHKVVELVHRHDMLNITGDMNSKMGQCVEGFVRVLGPHGVGNVNDNGEGLKEFCVFNEMLITAAIFPPK